MWAAQRLRGKLVETDLPADVKVIREKQSFPFLLFFMLEVYKARQGSFIYIAHFIHNATQCALRILDFLFSAFQEHFLAHHHAITMET